MIELDFPKLAETPIGTDPFPHLVVPGFVPAHSLKQVLSALPPLNRRGSFPPASVKLGPAALDLVRHMEGQRLRDLIAEAVPRSDATTATTTT